jgi:hypothetical protein
MTQSALGSWRSNGREVLVTLSDGSLGTIPEGGDTFNWVRAVVLDRLIGEEETFTDLVFSATLAHRP